VEIEDDLGRDRGGADGDRGLSERGNGRGSGDPDWIYRIDRDFSQVGAIEELNKVKKKKDGGRRGAFPPYRIG